MTAVSTRVAASALTVRPAGTAVTGTSRVAGPAAAAAPVPTAAAIGVASIPATGRQTGAETGGSPLAARSAIRAADAAIAAGPDRHVDTPDNLALLVEHIARATTAEVTARSTSATADNRHSHGADTRRQLERVIAHAGEYLVPGNVVLANPIVTLDAAVFVAWRSILNRRIGAPRSRITTVGSTLVVVIAVRRRASSALPLAAHIVFRASVGVVTDGCVGNEVAPCLRQAAVVCADIAIHTFEITSAHADSGLAYVVNRTLIPVVANALDWRVLTAKAGMARVEGTHVVIIAIKPRATHAGRTRTLVVLRARVSVVARGSVGRIDTPHAGFAGIVGAHVAVIAGIRNKPCLTSPVLARIPQRTDVTVVAGSTVVGVNTTQQGRTTVVSARILVVAHDGLGSFARARRAAIILGAEVTVVALGLIGNVLAPILLIAGVVGAEISIVTVHTARGNARSQVAVIASGTNVAVITGCVVEVVDTAQRRVTRIAGAHIGIVTSLKIRELALPIFAMVPQCAQVAVVASLVGRCVQTHSVQPARISGAGIAIVTGSHRTGLARPARALVVECARVPVITRIRVVHVLAPQRHVA